jgi:hypothetical protein
LKWCKARENRETINLGAIAMCLNCHVVTVDVEIKSLGALKAACRRLGWQFKENCHSYRWWGSWVDDSPVPRHLFATEEVYQRMIGLPRSQRQTEMRELLDRPDHAIHVPGFDYEIGVFRIGDQYQLSWDEVGDIDAVLGGQYHREVTNPLPQSYAIELEKQLARQHGYVVEEATDQNGVVQLTCTHYGA